MENYKIQNFETSLSFSCHFLALHFNRAAGFNVFIVSDDTSTVAVFIFEFKFTE